MNKLVDIIIPAYNAHKTIEKTLQSISIQTIIDNCNIIIVNDCGNNYNDIIDYYGKNMSITQITLSENSGPGVARNVGVAAGSAPYITFIDADDTFYGCFALEIFLKTMQRYKNCLVVSSPFYEQIINEEKPFVVRSSNMVWVFGKLYNRKFIETNKILFSSTRSNEDTGFNTLVELCLSNINEDEIVLLEDPFYCWHHNENSITRINNFEYAYNQNLPGYVENMIYAIEEAQSRNPFNIEKINIKKVDTMVSLYYLYCRLSIVAPENKKLYLKACVHFYNKVLKKYESSVSKEKYISQITIASNKRLTNLKDILPEITLMQFLSAIKGAEYNGKIN